MQEFPTLDAYHFHEQRWGSYDDLYDAFEWEIPDTFNMADYVCDRWAADEDRIAIYSETATGDRETYSFAELRGITNRLSNFLRNRGVERGDRVGVALPQRPETVMAHLAIFKLGAVSVPLSTHFGPDALTYRVGDCDITACFTDEASIEAVRETRSAVELETVVTVGETRARTDEIGFETAQADRSSTFETVSTDPAETAIILYTSGTTGRPKGVVHGHRLLLGFLPTILTTICNLDLEPGDVFWSPSEWAWIGTLYLVVFPPLFYGQPALAYNGESFDPETAYDLLDRYGVTQFFAPPTALRMMMQVDPAELGVDVTGVRTITSGGEALGPSIVDWVDETFAGAAINDWYGQTEADPIVTSCAALMKYREGRVGKPSLGVHAAVLDPETHEELPPGEIGEIAVRYGPSNPVCFEEYWNKPGETAEKIQDGWLLTEDLGARDSDGFVAFHGRMDDVIISAGYRIGPEEIEESLAGHEAVVDAGVIGISDDERGSVPKAYVVLKTGTDPSPTLAVDLKKHVRDRLAKYKYPRAIDFVDELPKTVTGKIRRHELRERDG